MGVHIYLFPSLTIISTPLKVIAYWVGSVDECRKGAPMMFREGADFIKSCSTGGIMANRWKAGLTAASRRICPTCAPDTSR